MLPARPSPERPVYPQEVLSFVSLKWTLNTSGYDSCVPLSLLCTQLRTNFSGYISSHSVSISSDSHLSANPQVEEQ